MEELLQSLVARGDNHNRLIMIQVGGRAHLGTKLMMEDGLLILSDEARGRGRVMIPAAYVEAVGDEPRMSRTSP